VSKCKSFPPADRGGDPCGGGKRIIGLELDYGPDGNAHRGERFLQRVQLREKCLLDAIARLVVRPDAIAKRLDDVIGPDADMSRFLARSFAARSAARQSRRRKAGPCLC